MTLGVVMLLMTGVYAQSNAFDAENGIITTPASEIPADGERFVTRVKLSEVDAYNLEFYEGEVILQDKKVFLDGEGKLVLGDGEILVGTFEKNYVLKGKVWDEDGSFYEGEFQDNRPHGVGKSIYANGEIEEGNFAKGELHGVGKHVYEDGEMYEGGFYEGLWHGQGKITYPDGEINEGIFEHGNFME